MRKRYTCLFPVFQGSHRFFAEVATSQDVPGFVSNALLMPFINEAIICLEKVLTIHRLVSIYN